MVGQLIIRRFNNFDGEAVAVVMHFGGCRVPRPVQVFAGAGGEESTERTGIGSGVARPADTGALHVDEGGVARPVVHRALGGVLQTGQPLFTVGAERPPRRRCQPLKRDRVCNSRGAGHCLLKPHRSKVSRHGDPRVHNLREPGDDERREIRVGETAGGSPQGCNVSCR